MTLLTHCAWTRSVCVLVEGGATLLIGTRIAALRRARGWTQQDLAVQAGIHVQTISAIERDARATAPTLLTLRALAKALDCSVDDLAGESEGVAT